MSLAPSLVLLQTPLHKLHLDLGAKMVPFAGYSMPVQYPGGLMSEHFHTRKSASLFDVSHMGQISLKGPNAAQALELLMPMDILGLAVNQQRYGLLTLENGGILDDLMVVNRNYIEQGDLFLVVNGACKAQDLAHIQQHIGHLCDIQYLNQHALLALQGPLAAQALSRLCSAPSDLVFMTGGYYSIDGFDCYITRSGYCGEDGFEISVHESHAENLALLLLLQPEVQMAGLGARNSLRLEAGLCLYGNDLDSNTNPVEANLCWALQKVRRQGGARAGGFIGEKAINQAFEALQNPNQQAQASIAQRVGLIALERIPVREPAPLMSEQGETIGVVSSGLLSPVLDKAIAMAYLPIEFCKIGSIVYAQVRDKKVAMQVCATPFVPHRYHRGLS